MVGRLNSICARAVLPHSQQKTRRTSSFGQRFANPARQSQILLGSWPLNETNSLVSPRAEESDQARDSKPEVERTITQLDSTMSGEPPRRIFMRRYLDEVLDAEMLLRVVVEETDAEMVVVTLYKTSKFRKYEARS
jgi:hypothetical protein